MPKINGGFVRWVNHLFLWAIYTMAMFNNKRVMLSNLCLEKRHFEKPHLPRVCFPTNQAIFLGSLTKRCLLFAGFKGTTGTTFKSFFHSNFTVQHSKEGSGAVLTKRYLLKLSSWGARFSSSHSWFLKAGARTLGFSKRQKNRTFKYHSET